LGLLLLTNVSEAKSKNLEYLIHLVKGKEQRGRRKEEIHLQIRALPSDPLALLQ